MKCLGCKNIPSYLVYGVVIRSFLPLPQFLSYHGKKADVVIRRGTIQRPSGWLNKRSNRIVKKKADFYLFYGTGVLFLIRNGNEIIVDAAEGTDEKLLQAALVGPCLAFLLYQRGYLVLHAGAVEMNGKAIAFAGAKGWGKSTLIASLHARGYNVVTDDLTVIKMNGEEAPIVWPGFPQVRLWPSSVRALGHSAKTMPKLHSRCEKRVHHLRQRFSSGPLPLGRIYILAKSKMQKIQPLPRQKALMELVYHSYGSHVEDHLKNPSHFFQCSSIVNRIPVHRLKRGGSLSSLPRLVELVEDDIKKHAAN